MTEQEKIDFYWLARTPGLGKKSVYALFEKFDSPGAIYRMTEKDARALFKPKQADHFLSFRASCQKEAEYAAMCAKEIRIVPFPDAEFPQKLRKIPDPPAWLFVKGQLPDTQVPSVAIVGARLCSEYGRYTARQFALSLAQAGVQIISGMASGIDGISQKAALSAGGKSFGVLGSSVEYCYPQENEEIYHMLHKQGGLLSEYPPGTAPQARLFPPRNRIISGLADIVLVVEARKRSGTLITVDMALEQGREIYAVPGRITDRLSDGCNDLIRQGAGTALTPQDILDNFLVPEGPSAALCTSHNIPHDDAGCPDPAAAPLPSISCSLLGAKILHVMDIFPVSPSEITERLAKEGVTEPVNKILSELTMLQLNGLLDVQGNYYIKKINS